MNDANEPDEVKYVSLGSFSPREADRLLASLRQGRLTFRIDVGSSPRTSKFSGMGRINSFVRVEVDESEESEARGLLKELGLEAAVTDDEIERASRWESDKGEPK